MSTPATISTPAARAPALLPPAPQKMSIPRIASVSITATIDIGGAQERFSRCATTASPRVSHSQFFSTRQPRLRSASSVRRSRATFWRNFSVPNRTLLRGVYANRQPSCRSQSEDVWRSLAQEKDLVVTSNGKPIAILSATTEGTLEGSLSALRQARAARGGRHAAARPRDGSRSTDSQRRKCRDQRCSACTEWMRVARNRVLRRRQQVG